MAESRGGGLILDGLHSDITIDEIAQVLRVPARQVTLTALPDGRSIRAQVRMQRRTHSLARLPVKIRFGLMTPR
jgi:hypothetical protein